MRTSTTPILNRRVTMKYLYGWPMDIGAERRDSKVGTPAP
jgi:hypothetical protein